MSASTIGIVVVVLVIIGIFALLGVVLWRHGKKIEEVTKAEIESQNAKESAEKNKQSAAIHSKPNISNPGSLADAFDSLPD